MQRSCFSFAFVRPLCQVCCWSEAEREPGSRLPSFALTHPNLKDVASRLDVSSYTVDALVCRQTDAWPRCFPSGSLPAIAVRAVKMRITDSATGYATSATLSHNRSFNKYISIAARATVQALKEEPRVKAEKRITEMHLRSASLRRKSLLCAHADAVATLLQIPDLARRQSFGAGAEEPHTPLTWQRTHRLTHDRIAALRQGAC